MATSSRYRIISLINLRSKVMLGIPINRLQRTADECWQKSRLDYELDRAQWSQSSTA
ncbi:hypothetical protein DPMN_006545 [Dreissena polymorpha]|uniref:Uncharacterized protein n=1 Tax=Dreissena polymorpha TaxID=45954 RepID=A0A9D4MS43_DREPO|nr:hypothetical protein DPMN_006545 [Dreissena polymorpha]